MSPSSCALLSAGAQVAEHLAHLVALLLHVVGHHGGEVVVLVLFALPVGDVGLRAEQLLLRLPHGLVCRDGDQVDGQHEVCGQRRQLAHGPIQQKGGVRLAKQHAGVLIPEHQVVGVELHAARCAAQRRPSPCVAQQLQEENPGLLCRRARQRADVALVHPHEVIANVRGFLHPGADGVGSGVVRLLLAEPAAAVRVAVIHDGLYARDGILPPQRRCVKIRVLGGRGRRVLLVFQAAVGHVAGGLVVVIGRLERVVTAAQRLEVFRPRRVRADGGVCQCAHGHGQQKRERQHEAQQYPAHSVFHTHSSVFFSGVSMRKGLPEEGFSLVDPCFGRGK